MTNLLSPSGQLTMRKTQYIYMRNKRTKLQIEIQEKITKKKQEMQQMDIKWTTIVDTTTPHFTAD
jgi:hypothetical protein